MQLLIKGIMLGMSKGRLRAHGTEEFREFEFCFWISMRFKIEQGPVITGCEEKMIT